MGGNDVLVDCHENVYDTVTYEKLCNIRGDDNVWGLRL